MADTKALPIPPLEMRQLVGPTDPAAFDNPTGAPVLPFVDLRYYDRVLDFGCGCGRLARKLIQQQPPPRSYLGIDLHRGMVRWCSDHLQPAAPDFRFEHHDVYSRGFNPKARAMQRPFPAADRSFTLAMAWSVFTHLTEAQAVFYLEQVRRVLTDDAIFFSTWFLFDKRYFPMMQDFQNALYINLEDPSNAVLFSREWLLEHTRRLGLCLIHAQPPNIRGFQWILVFSTQAEAPEVTLGEDDADFGLRRPPISPAADPSQIGLDRGAG